MESVSFIILTYNEARNIGTCLDSLQGFDDIHIVDSGSTDGTIGIVKSRGIGVYHQAFLGFGQQRNWAIANVPTANNWQFHLDADERLTLELKAEILGIAAMNPEIGGYLTPSKLMFAGQWLKYAGQYPAYQLRFFHKQRMRFVDHGHGQRENTSFPIGRLKEPLLHHAFSKGIDDWLIKHVKYARREAEQALAPTPPGESATFFSWDATRRRRAVKRLARRLPCRYFLRLFHMLVLKRAILDGWAGVTYAHMLASYEGMIEVYLRLLHKGLDLAHANDTGL